MIKLILITRKAMKGIVRDKPWHREPLMVGRGARDMAEYGPGASHRLHFAQAGLTKAAFNAQAATGAPVKAQEYEDGIAVVPRTPQDPHREVWVNQGGTTKHELSSLMNFHQGFFIVFFILNGHLLNEWLYKPVTL